MSPSYEVVLIHRGLDEFAREVAEAIRTATNEILVQPALLDFKFNSMPSIGSESQVVIVYLGSTEGRSDITVTAALEDAVRRPFPVLPIVRSREPGSIYEKVPAVIEHINAASWETESTAATFTLLAMLGLVEHERKVFLSYRRSESTQLATQLHTELVRNRFDVFLDRFALPPGEDFQKRLEEDLADKAFVVLLESSDLRHSPWVQYEITYALSHRIDMLAITLPGVAESELVPAIDEAFRIRLREGDCPRGGHCTSETLRSILERIEMAHAKALRRRREQMLGSLADQLHRDGCVCVPVQDWAILATANGRTPGVFLVSPRRPAAEDLYAAHLVRRGVVDRTAHAKLSGAVVHEVEHIPDERRGVLAWIGEVGDLGLKRLRECALEEETAA